jgi:hypothetical protein
VASIVREGAIGNAVHALWEVSTNAVLADGILSHMSTDNALSEEREAAWHRILAPNYSCGDHEAAYEKEEGWRLHGWMKTEFGIVEKLACWMVRF